MDFVTHLPWTQRRHDAAWVIVDRLTKSAHFLAFQMTFTLEEFYRVYIREIVPATWSVSLYRIGQRSQVYGTLLEEFPKVYGDTVDDEHCVSSTNRWLVGEDHIGFRGHVASMPPES